VHAKDDLVSGTCLKIEILITSWINQRFTCEVTVCLCSGSKWQKRVIKQAATVKKNHAQHRYSAAYQHVPQHHSAMILILHYPPIALDVFDTLSDRRDMCSEEAIFDHGS